VRSAEASPSPGAYLLRVKVSAAREAAALAHELEVRGASVEREGEVLTTVWTASDADDTRHWQDHYFPELVFFLRSWAGVKADRQLVVLEDEPLLAV
jgi:hypothetical protein